MPKLPVDFVKAPSFDNPLRSTASGPDTRAERKLVLHLDDATWEALWTESEREGTTPEAVVRRVLDRWRSVAPPIAMAPRVAEAPQVSPRARLFEQLHDQFARRSWLQCLLTVRAIVRESRV